MSRETEAETEREGVRPKRSWLRVLLGMSAVLFLAALGVGVWVVRNLPDLARARLIAESEQRGFQLQVSEVDPQGFLPWDDRPRRVVAKSVKVALTDNPKVIATVGSLVIDVKGYTTPGPIAADEVSLSAPDVPTLMAFETALVEGASKELELSASDVEVTLSSLAGVIPATGTLRARQVRKAIRGEVELDRLTAEVRSTLLGFELGPLDVGLEREADMLYLRPATLPFARGGISRDGERARLEVKGGTPELIRKVIPIDLPGKNFSGELELFVAGEKARKGSFALELDDYMPPHPKELDGILFGKTTRIAGKLNVGLLDVKLSEIELAAGGFKLKGDGNLGFSGALAVDLKGNVGCKDLATSALAAHVGAIGARLARQYAGDRLSGSISVRVTVAGSLANFASLRVSPSASVGCKVAI